MMSARDDYGSPDWDAMPSGQKHFSISIAKYDLMIHEIDRLRALITLISTQRLPDDAS